MPADVTGPVTGAGQSSADRPAPALTRATGLDAEVFGAKHWGREPLLVRRADTHGFRDLLDLDGVDELLSRRGLRTPFLRLARNGAVVDSSSFTGPGGVGAEIGDQVRDDKVAGLFAEGTTVVLQALHRLWPPVIDFATRLGAELGHPVQANAYVTPRASRGFSAHYDVHDVFVLQLAGRKHWTVHAPVHTDPLRDQPWNDHARAVAARARDDAPAIDTVLEPGDVLYLPRGWLHAATALGETSAHLTVGVHVVTRFALVEALTALVGDDPELRASLPLGLDLADPDMLDPHLDDVRAALHAAIDRVPAEAVARRVRRHVWTGGRPEPVRPVAAAAFAEGLAEGDTVRLRVGLHHRLTRNGTTVVLELPDRRIELPAATADAVRALLGGDALVVGGLPGMDGPDQIVLVRRLLREAVLVPADPA
ncbi:cupin domain-containing protein [Pseudonocardia sp.]|uniref:cupin domain-containing protein n=1 Tax=Pseudonocardia sp. TaxID=60912 RepID=UPI00261D277B|nr:cupin domain-containing protein [Pseudonocardia sp.]MCW2722103.1 cupin [Pseudonocardia sp.]MDT7616858.1 bifunctional lysine-specific demethylase and histidyl-hydroxylase [Pseudonocardiales bacterium]